MGSFSIGLWRVSAPGPQSLPCPPPAAVCILRDRRGYTQKFFPRHRRDPSLACSINSGILCAHSLIGWRLKSVVASFLQCAMRWFMPNLASRIYAAALR